MGPDPEFGKSLKAGSLDSKALGAETIGGEAPRLPEDEEGGQNSWLPELRSRLPSSGSFILMYFFMLLLFGIPLLYMEMIMGKWLRVDNIRVWKQLVPWLGGIGYAGLLVNEGRGPRGILAHPPAVSRFPISTCPSRPSGPMCPPPGVHLSEPV